MSVVIYQQHFTGNGYSTGKSDKSVVILLGLYDQVFGWSKYKIVRNKFFNVAQFRVRQLFMCDECFDMHVIFEKEICE